MPHLGPLQDVLAILCLASYLAAIALYRYLLRRHPRIELGDGRRLERVTYRPRVGGPEILRNMLFPGWGVVAAGDRWAGGFLMLAHAGFAAARLLAITDLSRRLLELALALSAIVSLALLFGRGERRHRYELRRDADRPLP